MSNIIFLDVDGPLIPASLYSIDMYCSAKRTIISTTALGWVKLLCKEADAKIVMNSAHNCFGDLKGDLITLGFYEDMFHNDWQTDFPNGKSKPKNRMEAIDNWIDKNYTSYYECNWVCFDDLNFTKLKRLICVNFNDGILHHNYLKAHEILGTKPSLLIFK